MTVEMDVVGVAKVEGSRDLGWSRLRGARERARRWVVEVEEQTVLG
jgi:hypothetical protein